MLVIYGSLTAKPVQLDISYFDKLSHLVSYFILMAWFNQLYTRSFQHFFCALLFIVLGIVLEYMQAYGGVRFFEWADVLANLTGVLLGLILAKTRLSNSLRWLEMHMAAMHSH